MEKIRTLNKVDIAIITVARDIMGLKIGDRLKSVKEYSEELQMSVGSVQKAFEILESKKCISLSKKGVFGKILEAKYDDKLIKKAFINSIVGVMPLPYSKRYEGLAMAIKNSFEKHGITFYFAYMQGSRVRLKLLESGIYDFALMSNLAFKNSDKKNIKKVFSLGPESYVSKHVLLKVPTKSKKIRVGIDKNSEDQYFLSNQYFSGKDYEVIDVNSDNIVKDMQNSLIDQAILSLDEIEEKLINGIEVQDIFDKEYINLANEAVIVINKSDKLMESLVKNILDIKYIKKIQKDVLEKIIVPRY